MAAATETQASTPAPDGLYRYDGLAGGVTRFDSVTEREIARFREQGYLVVHEAFAIDRVQDALDGLLDLLAGRSPSFDSVDYESSVDPAMLDGMAAEERQDYVRKFMWFVGHDERLRTLSEDPALMGVVRRIIGEEPMLFQDMALLKPPRVGREKPWHQDHAYFDLELRTRVVGVWIALDPATTGNGCMLVKPGSHLQGPVVHFKRRDWQICDTDVDPLGTLGGSAGAGRVPVLLQLHAARHRPEHERPAAPRGAVPLPARRRRAHQPGGTHGRVRLRGKGRDLLTGRPSERNRQSSGAV